MNKYAWVVTYTSEVELKKLKWKFLIIESMFADTFTAYVFGKTQVTDGDELIKQFEELGELESYDVSFSLEDKMVLLNDSFDKSGVYESAFFEGPEVSYEAILDRFQETYEVISVREVEESELFGNRIVKVDFVY